MHHRHIHLGDAASPRSCDPHSVVTGSGAEATAVATHVLDAFGHTRQSLADLADDE
jgi:hypothetical protein